MRLAELMKKRPLIPIVAVLVTIALLTTVLLSQPSRGRAAAGDGSRHCTVKVASRGRLLQAAANARNTGAVICVRAGSYGHITFRGRNRRLVSVIAAPHEHPALGQVDLENVSNLRIQGFDMPTGGFDTDQTRAHDVQIVANTIHDCFCQALRLWPGDSDILFRGNYVHNIHYNGDWQTGWGVKADGGTGVRILYNTFSNLQNDAMEIGSASDWHIIGNIVTGVHDDPHLASAHADVLMLWASDRRFTVRDNRFVDSTDVLVSGSTSDVTFQNNLIVHMVQLCVDGGPTGTSSAGVVHYTWIHNTIYDCGSDYNGGGFGGSYGLNLAGPATAGASNTVKCNILASLGFDTHAEFAYENYNILAHWARGSGRHDRRIRPHFANRVNYQATNLPFDAGYRLAPAGSPLAPGSIATVPRHRTARHLRSTCR
jgi:hypothetical protein